MPKVYFPPINPALPYSVDGHITVALPTPFIVNKTIAPHNTFVTVNPVSGVRILPDLVWGFPSGN